MRYYLVKIAFNKNAGSEDRPAPAAYDTFDDANKAFHSFMYQSINGSTIGWALAVIIDDLGNVHKVEKWTAPTEE